MSFTPFSWEIEEERRLAASAAAMAAAVSTVAATAGAAAGFGALVAAAAEEEPSPAAAVAATAAGERRFVEDYLAACGDAEIGAILRKAFFVPSDDSVKAPPVRHRTGYQPTRFKTNDVVEVAEGLPFFFAADLLRRAFRVVGIRRAVDGWEYDVQEIHPPPGCVGCRVKRGLRESWLRPYEPVRSAEPTAQQLRATERLLAAERAWELNNARDASRAAGDGW